MSGIAGIYNFRNQEINRADLERMKKSLQSFGPDRNEILIEGAVGLSHMLMRMTPEDNFDRQPLKGADGLVICGDMRIDNRAEIANLLSIPANSLKAMSDAELVLLGYKKFENSIWKKLKGPFAVALWNSNAKELILVRDQMGLNTVVWFKSDSFFAFASAPKGLLCLEQVPRALNEEKFADFLVLNHSDHETTVYKNIYRVPPASFIRVSHNGEVSKKSYWSFDQIKPIRLASDQDYADGLRHVLERAIRRQMRSLHPICSHLSGGLDSSSIATLAAKVLAEQSQRLPCYTHLPRKGYDLELPSGWYADEKPFVEAVAKTAGNIDVTFLSNDKCDDFLEVDRFNAELQAPIRNPMNMGWMFEITRMARSRGQRVLFSGATWELHIQLGRMGSVRRTFSSGTLLDNIPAVFSFLF